MIWQNDGGFVALKQAAEGREGQTQRKCQKPAVSQKTTDDDEHKLLQKDPRLTIAFTNCINFLTVGFHEVI